MSYIVTSSSQDRYSSTKYGIEKANSYENYIGNPMRIPPNSKVALESIKFIRLPVFTILSDDSKRAYYWFGEDKTPSTGWNTIDDTRSAPVSFQLKSGTYNTDQLALGIQDAIRKVQYHTADKPITVTANYTSVGSFEGFTYTFAQKDQFIPSVIPTEEYYVLKNTGNATPYDPLALMSYSVVGTTGEITGWMAAGNTVPAKSIIFPQHPISLNDGELVYDISNTGEYHTPDLKPKGGWVCSLTRPQRCSKKNSELQWEQLGTQAKAYPDYFHTNGVDANGGTAVTGWSGAQENLFADYSVGVCPKDNTPALLEVVCIASNAAADQVKRRACPYYNTTDPTNLFGALAGYYNMDNRTGAVGGNADGGGLPDVDGANTPALKNITKVKFLPKGETVSIEVYAEIYDTTSRAHVPGWTPLMAYNATSITDGLTLPPINMNKWALYPKVTMFCISSEGALTNQKIIIDSYIPATDMGGTEWWSNNWYTSSQNDGGTQIEKDIDIRLNNDFGKEAKETTTHGGAQILADYNQQIVMQPSNDWTPVAYLTPEPSLGPTLGWKSQSYLYQGMPGHTGTNDDNVYVSPNELTDIPEAEAEHSLFVRCPTLTQLSHNFSKGQMSKIIYHCPMFSNSGKSTGSLFFQPAERVYIDLGNKETLNINQIALDIVDRNEQLSGDLTGNTTICLHIKQ
mgnify:CR=1 FL=1|tara:strand:+ start:278 stop:2332 length:2055 start_codon:yes stop_codon:yes gene_type:complete